MSVSTFGGCFTSWNPSTLVSAQASMAPHYCFYFFLYLVLTDSVGFFKEQALHTECPAKNCVYRRSLANIFCWWKNNDCNPNGGLNAVIEKRIVEGYQHVAKSYPVSIFSMWKHLQFLKNILKLEVAFVGMALPTLTKVKWKLENWVGAPIPFIEGRKLPLWCTMVRRSVAIQEHTGHVAGREALCGFSQHALDPALQQL